MPLREMLPVGRGCAQWRAWGTVARIVVTEPSALDRATGIVRAEMAAVDAACSRFRTDSETARLAVAGGRPVRVSPLLRDLVDAALCAAEATNGDVDPTLGRALCALGYDRDFAGISVVDGRHRVTAVTPVSWRDIVLDDDLLTIPAGCELDLGATAKAWTADRCAARIAAECGCGVLVALGGDIATAGAASLGWEILISDGPDEPAETVVLPDGAALATSSTISRSWRRSERTVHHILDPRTSQPAPRVWRTASAAAFSCLRANALSTAAVVRGAAAVGWLHQVGAPARLVAADRSVLHLAGWPSASEAAA